MVNSISAYLPTLAPVEQGEALEYEIYLKRGMVNAIRGGVYLAFSQLSLCGHELWSGTYDLRSFHYAIDEQRESQILRKIHKALLTVQIFNFASCQVSRVMGFDRYLRLPEAFTVLAQEYALRFHERDGIVFTMIWDLFTATAIRMVPDPDL